MQIISTLSKFKEDFTIFKKPHFLLFDSINVILVEGNIIANGIPGNPAPVPMSKILVEFLTSSIVSKYKLSKKCFKYISLSSIMLVYQFLYLIYPILL